MHAYLHECICVYKHIYLYAHTCMHVSTNNVLWIGAILHPNHWPVTTLTYILIISGNCSLGYASSTLQCTDSKRIIKYHCI